MVIQYDEELQFAVGCAKSASEILLKYFGSLEKFDLKTPDSVVTQADRESEAYIREEILKAFPDDGIVGEEESFHKGKSGRLWIVDPLDGTNNFAASFPVWCVSIGLWESGRPVVGVIYDPLRDECFYGASGGTAKLNDKIIKVSKNPASPLTNISGQSSLKKSDNPEWNVRIMSNYKTKCLGSAAIQLAYVACGRTEATYAKHTWIWDVAAGWLLIELAGGKITDLKGNDRLPMTDMDEILGKKEIEFLGTNGTCHKEILEKIFF